MKKSLSLLLALALFVSLLAGLGLPALADGSDAALALYVQNEGKDAELVRRYTAIALTWGVGNLDENTVPDIAVRVENTGNLRFVCGMTAEEAEEMTAPGDRMPIGVVGITVVTP